MKPGTRFPKYQLLTSARDQCYAIRSGETPQLPRDDSHSFWHSLLGIGCEPGRRGSSCNYSGKAKAVATKSAVRCRSCYQENLGSSLSELRGDCCKEAAQTARLSIPLTLVPDWLLKCRHSSQDLWTKSRTQSTGCLELLTRQRLRQSSSECHMLLCQAQHPLCMGSDRALDCACIFAAP